MARMWLALAVAPQLLPIAVAASQPAKPEPVAVGAIRWDAWTPGREWEANLGPPQWHDRLPFYGREVAADRVEISAGTQEVMDQEIAYAHSAGLDYWAYCFSLPTDLSAEPDEYALALHLSSTHKEDVHFAFVLMGPGYWGPKEDYPKAAERLAAYFADPAYQKVQGGRPLLFIFYTEALTTYFGTDDAIRQGLDTIRAKAVEAGLRPPLIVADVWSAESGADLVDRVGFDAISGYTCIDFANYGDQEYPYANLATANLRYWDAIAATGKQAVPIVTAGWDHRPRWRDPARFEELYKSPPRGPWYVPPTPRELAANVQSALDWVGAHPESAQPGAIVIYAWNESDEGGWLVPTHSEGTSRLDALASVLRPAPAEAPAP
jgi:hypothetical protein